MEILSGITPEDYLGGRGIEFHKRGKELIAHCVFNACDSDSRGAEGHLYVNAETGQYECKKCGERGNLITLAKHFGEDLGGGVSDHRTSTRGHRSAVTFSVELVESCHQALPDRIWQYLNGRGITNEVIQAYKIGWGEFYRKKWITIPIADECGVFRFFKLRQDPGAGNNKVTYPKGVEAQIYGWETLTRVSEKLIICEGELDRLALLSRDVPAITSTHGAMTFKREWSAKLEAVSEAYICFDNDDAGRKGARRVAELLAPSGNKILIVDLPAEVGEGGDITDYLVRLGRSPDDLFGKHAKEYPERIDTSQLEPLSSQMLAEILGLTIKHDDNNKIVTFLCELSAFTDSAQFNVSYNAPSATGKSYIPTEIARNLSTILRHWALAFTVQPSPASSLS